LDALRESLPIAEATCRLLLSFKPAGQSCTPASFLALIPNQPGYGYFGHTVRCSDGWEASTQKYTEYLSERAVPYSHAKRSSARGQPLLVGAMARLALFADRLGNKAKSIYQDSDLPQSNTNTLWNNFAQAIEIVEAIDRCQYLLSSLLQEADTLKRNGSLIRLAPQEGAATGAVECPRGTLYHRYTLDGRGIILSADMVTPSAQNTRRIEMDITRIVEELHPSKNSQVQQVLETLVRAYDPCNTCATHMVNVTWD
jgi:coenzyme F420-reducing hydrogenase alpha subunit